MSRPDSALDRSKWLRAAGTITIAVLSACQGKDRQSASTVIGPDALTVIGEDSLATAYIDVADLGGAVAYLSSTEPFVTIIGKNGHVSRQFGVPGEGPGDFRNPTSIDAQADTLYIWEVRLGAASMYDTLGQYLGRRRADANFGGVAPTTRMDYAGRPGLYRRFDSIAVTPAYPNGVSLPGEQRSYSLLAVNNLGAVLDTVWASSLPASANAQVQGQPMHLVPIPLWARCSNTRLVVYDPVVSISTLRAPEGGEIRQVESRANAVQISAEDLQRYVAFHFHRLYMTAHLPEPSSMAEAVTEMVQQGRIKGAYPSGFAGYTSILCDRHEHVWLDEFSLEDSPLGYSRTWVVLSGASGKRTVTLPEGFRLMLLSGNRGYGILLDSTSAESPAWIEFSE
jgi:hypothetical protein